MGSSCNNGAINMELALRNCEGDKAFMLELLQSMSQTHEQQIAELQQAQAVGDITALK